MPLRTKKRCKFPVNKSPIPVTGSCPGKFTEVTYIGDRDVTYIRIPIINTLGFFLNQEGVMAFKEKFENAFVSKATEGFAISLGVLLIWVGKVLAPIVVPVLEQKLSKESLVSLLLASLTLNILLVILFWILNNRSAPKFKLKYGIYWDSDKNPHCPNCKIPIAGYREYDPGWGYYCKPCGKVFHLTDASGKDIKPEQAIKEL